MTHRRLLISGIGKRNSTIKLLADECSTRGVELVGCDASELASARSGLAVFRTLPLATDPDFPQAYLALLGEHNIAASLTLIDPEITELGRLEAGGALGATALLHPPLATSLVCEDKFAFFEAMTAAGIPAVPTYLSPPDAFPYIRKDRRGSRGSGFHVFSDASDTGIDIQPGGQAVYQPWYSGQHFCVDAYYSAHSGNLVDLSAKEVLAKHDGESYLLRSVGREPFVDLLRGLAAALPLRGVVNVDVYGDDGGELAVMEINCRVGGNYPAAHAVGSNLLRHALREVLDGVEASEDFSDYAVGRYVSKFIGFSEPYDRVEHGTEPQPHSRSLKN